MTASGDLAGRLFLETSSGGSCAKAVAIHAIKKNAPKADRSAYLLDRIELVRLTFGGILQGLLEIRREIREVPKICWPVLGRRRLRRRDGGSCHRRDEDVL